jgi:hypothetical protein
MKIVNLAVIVAQNRQVKWELFINSTLASPSSTRNDIFEKSLSHIYRHCLFCTPNVVLFISFAPPKEMNQRKFKAAERLFLSLP